MYSPGRNLAEKVNLGRQFLDAKAMLPRGHFGPWLEENSPVSIAQAHECMGLARKAGGGIDGADQVEGCGVGRPAKCHAGSASRGTPGRRIAWRRSVGRATACLPVILIGPTLFPHCGLALV